MNDDFLSGNDYEEIKGRYNSQPKPMPKQEKKEYIQERNTELKKHGLKMVEDKKFRFWIIFAILMAIAVFGLAAYNDKFIGKVNVEGDNLTCPETPTCPSLNCPDCKPSLNCDYPDKMEVNLNISE